MNQPHNLDVSMYSLKDILELFNIHDYTISIEEMKNAKKKTLNYLPTRLSHYETQLIRSIAVMNQEGTIT